MMKRVCIGVLGVMFMTAGGCSDNVAPTAEVIQANFVNGNFETGDLSGWTFSSNLNPALLVVPPTQITDLNLQTGGTNRTFVRSGATPESVLAAGIGASDTLKYPRFGQYATVVNELGDQRNVNRLSQTMTTTAADVDPLDSRIHVRFCLAPVLENAGHPDKEQPYFYVEVNNTTQNKRLFNSFNFAGQAGVPWKTASTGSQYTDWQLFDLAVPAADLAVGDSVKMELFAAGCSAGGHYGHLYVDGFGAFVPGLTVAGYAAPTAQPGTNLVYTFQVKNGAAQNADGVVVTEVLPTGTTFVSVAGASCTTPAVGASGTVTCNLGTIAAGNGTTFQLTVLVDSEATGSINNGNYNIRGTGISPLIGPLVQSQIAFQITASILSGTGTLSCTNPVIQGQNSVCTITPATGFNFKSLQLDGVDVSSQVASGTFTIANVQAPHTVVAVFEAKLYSITTSVPGGNGTLSCQNPITHGGSSICVITPASGFALSALTDNGVNVFGSASSNTYQIVNATGPHAVQAAFGPATYAINATVAGGNGMISCSSPITHAQSAACTITPGPGYVLATLTVDGNEVTAQVMSGSYMLANVTAPHLVQATFAKALYGISVSVPGGNGTIGCTSPVQHGGSAQCKIDPALGYWLNTLTLNGNDVFGQVVGNNFQIPNITANQSLQGTFAPVLYTITTSVPGSNGTIVCTSPLVRGGSSICTITPAEGYALGTLTLDGGNVFGQISGNVLPIDNVTASHLVQGTFVVTTNVINIQVPGGNGTVDCTTPVVYGQGAICQIMPAPGYRIRDILLDSVDIFEKLSGLSFQIPSVTGPRTVQAVFEFIPLYPIHVDTPSGNGTINCTNPVREGEDAICTIAPAKGYELATLIVDGVDARILVQGGSFRIYRVTAEHKVDGAFRPADGAQCLADSECASGYVCLEMACVSGAYNVSGGGYPSCAAVPGAGTSAGGGGLLLLAVFALGVRRRPSRRTTAV